MPTLRNLVTNSIAALSMLHTAAFADITFFASDATNNIIRKYNSSGTEIGQVSNFQLNFPTLLAATADGKSIVTDINFVGPAGPDLIRLDLAGKTLARASSEGIFGISGGGIVSVVDTGRNTFLITSTINSQIAETDYTFNRIRLVPTNTSLGGLRTLGIAMSPDGNQFFVADADGQSGHGFLRIFDYQSGAQQKSFANPSIIFPVDLSFASNGNLFVSDRGINFIDDKINQFELDGTFIGQISSGAIEHANFGQFDATQVGRLLVLETNSPTQTPIRLLSYNGTLISEFGPSNARITDVIAVSTVPEPSTIVLFLVGSALIARSKRQA